MINKRAFLWFCAALLVAVCTLGQAAENDDHGAHQGHSDDLLILLRHKIALQKLQEQQLSDSSESTLAKQGRHFRQVMPLLRRYMAIPKSYYLTTEMYHDSLDNRAAMLGDFSMLLIQYQNQLVSPP
ncbi:MAG: hypothetical protein V7765_00650 [Oleispira sp.]